MRPRIWLAGIRKIVLRLEVPPDVYELYQERAAIRECYGGLPRTEADRLAMADVQYTRQKDSYTSP